jgi:Na+-transporting NADH:ubiquinone oxidoreductase subunit NqrA
MTGKRAQDNTGEIAKKDPANTGHRTYHGSLPSSNHHGRTRKLMPVETAKTVFYKLQADRDVVTVGELIRFAEILKAQCVGPDVEIAARTRMGISSRYNGGYPVSFLVTINR